MHSQDSALAAVISAVHNLIRYGEIEEVDHAAARVRVKLAGGVITGWRRWVTGMAGETLSWRPPEVGERVLYLSPSGNLAGGIAIAGLNCDDHPAPETSEDKAGLWFPDGAYIVYDHEAHKLEAVLPSGGTIHVVAKGGVTLDASDGGVSITGDVSVEGSIAATGNVSDEKGSMNEMRDQYNEHGGHSSGGPPSPQMD